MSTDHTVACPTITRFQLWDPYFLKDLVSGLRYHIADLICKIEQIIQTTQKREEIMGTPAALLIINNEELIRNNVDYAFSTAEGDLCTNS